MCFFRLENIICLRLSKRMWIKVKVLGRVCSTCQQVAVLPNIVDLPSRKAEVQTHRRSTSRLTAVYSRPVKKHGFESTTRIFSYLSLKKPFDVLFSLNFVFVFVTSTF